MTVSRRKAAQKNHDCKHFSYAWLVYKIIALINKCKFSCQHCFESSFLDEEMQKVAREIDIVKETCHL